MESRVPGSSGLLGSLRSFADGLLGSAYDRLELLGVELHEEKLRLVQIVIWISATIFLSMLAVVFASMALVVMLWESRVPVVCSLAGAYTAGLIAVVIGFRRYLKRQP